MKNERKQKRKNSIFSFSLEKAWKDRKHFSQFACILTGNVLKNFLFAHIFTDVIKACGAPLQLATWMQHASYILGHKYSKLLGKLPLEIRFLKPSKA